MENLIVILVLLLIFISAGGYIYNQKKKGVKCVGCPHSINNSDGSCSCNH